jgi:hypothetical protein
VCVRWWEVCADALKETAEQIREDPVELYRMKLKNTDKFLTQVPLTETKQQQQQQQQKRFISTCVLNHIYVLILAEYISNKCSK